MANRRLPKGSLLEQAIGTEYCARNGWIGASGRLMSRFQRTSQSVPFERWSMEIKA